jgi:glycosyltransferase involved in cell wall biosynthesis
VLVCDFTPGLVSRILDVYKDFAKKPEIVLVRRRRSDPFSYTGNHKAAETQLFADREVAVHPEVIPIPVKLEDRDNLVQLACRSFLAVAYLLNVLLLLPLFARDRSVRVVHAHFLLPQGLAGLLISRAARAPLILTATGSDVYYLAMHALPRKLMRCILFPKSSRIIAVSQDLYKRLQTLGCRNLTYVPNCVEMPRWVPEGQHNSRKILFVGNLVTAKRPHVLIHAFDRVARQIPDATLTVVGNGPILKDLEVLASKLGLLGRTRFTGYMDSKQLGSIYRESGIFVLPSVREGLSTALLEAMSFGLRIIVSEPAGSGIIENGVNGLIFRVDDVDELAMRILWMIENPAESSRLSSTARSICELEYARSVVAPKLEQLYSEVCHSDCCRSE